MASTKHHIAITYQYRVPTDNLATLEEERHLASQFGVHSCQYECWEQSTMAMSYSATHDEPRPHVQAARHLLKMIFRKHGGRQQVRILTFFQDAKDQTNYYTEHLNNLLG